VVVCVCVYVQLHNASTRRKSLARTCCSTKIADSKQREEWQNIIHVFSLHGCRQSYPFNRKNCFFLFHARWSQCRTTLGPACDV